MKRWKYVSLRTKLIASAAAILVLGVLAWALMDYPTTDEGWLRRAERGAMLAEGDVLLRIDTRANGPDFLAADGGKYLELYRLPSEGNIFEDYDEGFFLYERAGDLTTVVLPSRMFGRVEPGYVTCCMLLFDERPEVQRVELSFTIHDYSYTGQAQREVGGVFLCYFQVGESVYYDDFTAWKYMPEVTRCSARLYAADGSLIEETDVPMGKLV